MAIEYRGPDDIAAWWRLYGLDEAPTSDDEVRLSWGGSLVSSWTYNPDVTSVTIGSVTYYRGAYKVLTQPEGNTFVFAEAWGVGRSQTTVSNTQGIEIRNASGKLTYSTADTTWNFIGSFMAPANTTVTRSFPQAAGLTTSIVKLQYNTLPGNQDATLHTVTAPSSSNGYICTATPSSPKGVNVTDPAKNNKFEKGVTNKVIGMSASTLIIVLGR